MPIVSHSQPWGRGAGPVSWGPFAGAAAPTNPNSAAHPKPTHAGVGAGQPGGQRRRKEREGTSHQTLTCLFSIVGCRCPLADAMQLAMLQPRAVFTAIRAAGAGPEGRAAGSRAASRRTRVW